MAPDHLDAKLVRFKAGEVKTWKVQSAQVGVYLR
jgi:hypothetical protein